MNYSSEDMAYIKRVDQEFPSKHVSVLARLMSENAPYSELFAYGMQYLPRIRNQKTGKVDLEKLEGFSPQVVEYFHAIADIPTLPKILSDVATDFACYADGESVQQDSYFFSLNPESVLKKALHEIG